jgi:hypothetical protein
MTPQDFAKLKKGDIVCHRSSGDSYVILDDMPPFPAVRLIHVSNPTEWVKFIHPVPTAPGQTKASAKSVLWVLNQLQAAPGQPNRELVRKFLYSRGWIGPANLPEEWSLDHVPMMKKAVAALASEIQQFEIDNKKPVTP